MQNASFSFVGGDFSDPVTSATLGIVQVNETVTGKGQYLPDLYKIDFFNFWYKMFVFLIINPPL